MFVYAICEREWERRKSIANSNSIYKVKPGIILLRSFFFKKSLLCLSLCPSYILYTVIFLKMDMQSTSCTTKLLHVLIMEGITLLFLHMFLYWSQYGVFYRV